ncbi:hypothetical protein BDQ17DRAFT_966601 [Cyathus striatus]|nr:hypothetical protein BDQ17DRAFT_1093307 [Cyathus striatus]KAF8995931.1 hypothetical protein BDQ17DRAFT_966601 [Cyathus striatus]
MFSPLLSLRMRKARTPMARAYTRMYLTAPEQLEYSCPSCAKSVGALKQTELVIHAKKFQIVNLVPAKLDIPLILPKNDELVFTEEHIGHSLQPGEEELPKDAAAAAAAPQFNAEAMS